MKTSKEQKLKTAIEYAQRGWAVFPVHSINETNNCTCRREDCSSPGKHPITANGFKDATRDIAQLTKWFDQYPWANLALATGSISNVVVVDIDDRHNGSESLTDLEARIGKFPDTLKAKTGGGFHYYFKTPKCVIRNKTNLLPGIDIRGDGGYVVVPPSNHKSGNHYEWINTREIADLPEGLLKLLCEKEIPVQVRGDVQEGFLIKSGARNSTLASIGGALRSRGLSETTIEKNLLFINENECEIPLPEKEVVEIARSISRYDASQRQLGQLTSLKDLLASDDDDKSEYLVDGLLHLASLSLLAGKPKAGKTTLARQLSACVAKGIPFLGKSIQQGPVIYVAREEKKSEMKRHFLEMGLGEIPGDLIFFCFDPLGENPVPILKGWAMELKPRLIVIDTLQKVVRIKDTNNYSEVSSKLEPIMDVARASGAHILCLHHMGKGERTGSEGVLGSTAITGATDTNLFLERGDQGGVLASQQRYGEDLPKTVLPFSKMSRTFQLGVSVEENQSNQIKTEIVQFISDHPECLEAEIKDGVGGNSSVRVKALRSLVADAKIIRHGNGGKSDPFKYSAVTPLKNDSTAFVKGPPLILSDQMKAALREVAAKTLDNEEPTDIEGKDADEDGGDV